jgi:hypothetical protein
VVVDGPTRITIAAPFEFDLATIPRIFWPLIAPFELSIVAPLAHDFLYLNKGDPPPPALVPPRTYTRADADALFRRLMRAEGIPAWRRVLAYAAVRVFGAPAWGTAIGVRPR